MVRRQRGYSLVEMLVVLAIFGGFILVMVVVTTEMNRAEKRWPIDFLAHPEPAAVVARMRKDVSDALYYPAEFLGYTQSPRTLIIYSLQQTGEGYTVVYDFREEKKVRRKAYRSKQLVEDWVANGVPQFIISAYTLETGEDAVRLTAHGKGGLVVDEIFIPRPHA